MVDAPLWEQTTTDIPGEDMSEGKCDSRKVLLTALKAGLAARFRSVSPNFQSSTRYLPWYHSSAHANTTTPQQPCRKIVRICQSKVSACFSSPLRRLSNPISLRRTGLSWLKLCNTPMYCSKACSDSRSRLKHRHTR